MARPAELHHPGRAGAANQSTVSRSSRSPYHSCRFARPLSTAGILLLSACDATGGPSGGAARTTPLRVRSGGRSRSLVGRSQVLRWPGGSGLRSQLRVPPHTRATRVNHGGHPGLSEIAARLRVLSVHTSHHVQDLTQMGGQLEEALAAPPHPLP